MKILPQFTKSAISVSVLCLFPLCSSASWGDSSGEGPTHETFPAYEVGDIAIFGPADEDLEEVGHSAILGPRLKVGTVWEVQLIDVMPTGGVTANQDVGVHGPLEKILTVSGLADGAWTSAKQSERADIYNSASQRIGSQYITIEPPNTSDLSWSYINSLVTAYNGSNYVIQSDSIYATPAGGHDYFPRQKGAEVGRYTCVGFTEGIYESLGLDITPSGQEAVEYSYDAWYTLGIDLARAYVFWPSVQRDNGTASQPKGPEVSITIPAHNSVFNETDITVEGEAKDVSGLREDEILLKHTAPDGESTEYEVPVSVSEIHFHSHY